MNLQEMLRSNGFEPEIGDWFRYKTRSIVQLTQCQDRQRQVSIFDYYW